MSDSDNFFCNLITILFPFQIKKEKFKFFSKFRNIFENVVFDQKTAKLPTLQNWLHRSKNDCQIRNQRPHIREIRYFLAIRFVIDFGNAFVVMFFPNWQFNAIRFLLVRHIQNWKVLIMMGVFKSNVFLQSIDYCRDGPSPCKGIPAGILPLNLAQISSIYGLTGSFMAIQDGLQCFVSLVLCISYR